LQIDLAGIQFQSISKPFRDFFSLKGFEPCLWIGIMLEAVPSHPAANLQRIAYLKVVFKSKAEEVSASGA
jgi:hypothetical protein